MTELSPAMRHDVRLLSTALGRVLEEAGGSELLRDVERLRRATIALRRDASESRRRTVVEIVAGFDANRAEQVARAFTCYFQLVNLAEEHQRVRALRERRDVDDSLAAGLRTARERIGDEGARALVERLEITPVLTAHPTEARRRAVIETLWRIGELLERFDDPRFAPREHATNERRLHEEITSLWRTDPVRVHPPEPLDEVRAGLALFDQTIFRALPLLCRELDEAIAPGSGERPQAFTRPPLRWGSWIGGDRDGNPHVTPEVTREAARIANEHVLLGLEAETRRIARTLSAGERDTPASDDVEHALARGESLLPRAAKELRRKLPDASHRRALALSAHRLAATRTADAAGYENAKEFVRDVDAIQRSLAAAGAPRLAYGELQHLRWQAEAFGFHLTGLEVRQHAVEVDRDPDDVLATLTAMADVQGRFGPDACRRYIVSFTRTAADVVRVLELADRVDVPLELDVVPLFESRDDLRNATEVLNDLVKDPRFADRVHRNGDRLEVMLGYSDSAKENGVLAANVELFEAQLELATWARHHDLRLTIFHGRGGALGRGGGPANRAILGQAPGSVDGRFKVTEQGEVAFARYGDPRIARRHLEQLVNAVVIASTPEHEATQSAAWDRFGATARAMADTSALAYRDLVEHAGFTEFFLRSTPIEAIERLRIGSRPARRRRSLVFEDLRAIPWVFAWSQSRVNLAGWFGLGSGLAGVPVRELRAMHRGWPFFTSLIENAELSLAKADLPIAQLYLELGDDASIAKPIEEELALTTERVLAITGRERPLDGRPILRRAIDLRNPYVDALSFLQLRFLREARAPNPGPELDRLVQITVNGVAAGLQNTG